MTQNTQANELNIQDLALARAVIELATERGTFKANELANVGAQAKAAQEGAKAAAAEAVEAPATPAEETNGS
jgi:hypothetical protein